MPRRKKPHIATLDEVVITRNGDYADIAYRDPTVGGVNLEIGPEVARMTDQEILNCHNETILVMQQSVTKILSQLENGKETAELGKTQQVLQKMGLELYVFPRSADPFKER